MLICLLSTFFTWRVQAVLTIEIAGGSEGSLPIAIVPFGYEGFDYNEDITKIISNDLSLSGRFILLPIGDLASRPHEESEINFRYWRLLRSESLLVGKISSTNDKNYLVQFQLLDVY